MKKEIKPDILVKARFLTTEEEGRKSGISTELFRCPFEFEGKYFDCGLIINGIPIELGKTYSFPLVFLCPELIKHKLKIGAEFTLWEGKTIAAGKVLEIYN